MILMQQDWLSTMKGDVESLSDRERETLRLLGRGHDAKSIASALDLSVHTVNERLRDVRRKLGVSSSREAARLLMAREAASEPPNNLGYKEIGVAVAGAESAYSFRSLSRATGAKRPLIYALMGIAMLVVLTSVLTALSLSGADAPAPSNSRPARSTQNPSSLFMPADYPTEALARRAQGATRYRLQISEIGRAEKCDIEGSSGSAALDQATCQVMISRSRFYPALDVAGRPVASIFTGTIRWIPPE
jgi:TonB family protein